MSADACASKSACILRIIHITDVYTLENFPRLRNLIIEKRSEVEALGGKAISILTGDFLAPYLLSSMDHGFGMISMLNAVPIDFLTWGNHEDDVPHQHVMRREKEYKGVWINTNMQSHESFKDSSCQKDREIIDLQSTDGSNSRRVGLIGILTNQASLYRKGAFGGASIDDPWDTMRIYKEKLELEDGCDLVVPLCHLYEPQDEITCREFDFPLVLSGHDHHVVNRVIEGTLLIKPGQDGIHAFVVDITWQSATTPRAEPEISAVLLKASDWPPDEKLAQLARKAYCVLAPLKQTQLAFVPKAYRPLTSFGTRDRRVSMATYLLSRTRDAINQHDDSKCDCCIVKGGSIRGGRHYTDDEHITLEVLQSELEEQKTIVVVPVPGDLLRIGLRETWLAPNPGWMQYDDGIICDDDGYVMSIAGKELDGARTYHVATVIDFWRKRDSPSIGEYFEQHPELLPHKGNHVGGAPWHALLLRLWAADVWSLIWSRLDTTGAGTISMEDFERMGLDSDGKLTKVALKKALSEFLFMETPDGDDDLIVDHMIQQVQPFQRLTSNRLNHEALNSCYRHHVLSQSNLPDMVHEDGFVSGSDHDSD